MSNDWLNALGPMGTFTKLAIDKGPGLWDSVKGAFGGGGSAPTYTPDANNFQYGLGPAGSFANQQADKFSQQQAQLQALGADAYNRKAPTQAMPDAITQVQSGGQGYLQGADAAGRAAQLQALGGIQSQTGALNNFANRQQGPSAAQAQLQAGTDAAARQQYGMARSQPGGGGAALRNAAFNAAGISGNAANSAATLRANEDQAFQAQRLQALGAAQQGAGMSAGGAGLLRQGDQGFAQTQAGQANYDAGAANQFNQGQQQLQFNVGANNLNAAGQARGQNDAMTLGTIQGVQGLNRQITDVAKDNSSSGVALENAKATAAGLGSANHNAEVANNQRTTDMLIGAGSSAAGYAAVASDIRAKKDIKPVSVLAALGGGDHSKTGMNFAQRAREFGPELSSALGFGRSRAHDANARSTGPGFDVQSQINDAHDANARSAGPDTSLAEFGGLPSRVGLGAAGDARQARLDALLGSDANSRYHAATAEQHPSTWGTGDVIPDMRPAQGYEYSYKDPEADGAGRYVGPMAQDLEHLPGVVEQGPDGKKAINAPRLTLANTAAVSELQNKMDRVLQLQALGAGNAPNETTSLSPEETPRFQDWVKKNNIRDLDNPESHYDYRGFWKQYGDQPHQQGAHFTDEFKQHGHPSFSVESNYSKGIGDGGYWDYPNGKEQYSPSLMPKVPPIDTAALDEAYRRQQLQALGGR